jgi:HSP20 family protein
MVALNNVVNSLVDNTPAIPVKNGNGAAHSVKLNVYEDKDSYYVLAVLPGLEADKIELSVKENVLTISGDYDYGQWPVLSRSGNGQPEVLSLLSEAGKGKFHRQIKLSARLEADKIEALYENGLLKLTLPKAETAKVKRIAVQSITNS